LSDNNPRHALRDIVDHVEKIIKAEYSRNQASNVNPKEKA
jgi:hypothetical protein